VKVFASATVLPGNSVGLTFAITNPDAIALTGIGFTDLLPSGLLVSTPNGLAAGCGGGTIMAVAGTNSISLSGATLPAGTSCTFAVSVTASAALTQLVRLCNTSSSVTSNEGGNGFPAFACVTVGSVAIEPTDAFQLSYASNLTIGDSVVSLTNAGTLNGFDPGGQLCANVYTFDPSEELISCCACLVTPDGLRSLSAKQDLVSNTLTPGVPGSIVVKLLASAPVAGSCDASSPSVQNLVPGLRGWSASLHQNTSTGAYHLAENVFQNSVLSDSELTKLTTYCGFIETNGSSFGICKACRFGALGGVMK